MSRAAEEIIRDIDTFAPADGAWLDLDNLLNELFEQPVTADGIAAMLRVFERFPTGDGAGVLWSIVHGLESLTDYEPHLVASVRRRPSELGVLMLHRILKSGEAEAAGVPILSIFAEVATRTDVDPSVRQQAQQFLKTDAD